MKYEDYQLIDDISNNDFEIFEKLLSLVEEAGTFSRFKFRYDQFNKFYRSHKDSIKMVVDNPKFEMHQFDSFEEIEKTYYYYQNIVNLKSKKKEITDLVIKKLVKNNPNLASIIRKYLKNTRGQSINGLNQFIWLVETVNRQDFKKYVGDLGKYNNFQEVINIIHRIPEEKLKSKIASRLRVQYREEFLKEYFSEIKNRLFGNINYNLYEKYENSTSTYVEMQWQQYLEIFDKKIRPALKSQAKYDSIDDIFYSIIDYKSDVSFDEIKHNVKKTRGAWIYHENKRYLIVRLRSFSASKKLSPKNWCIKNSFYWYTDSGLKFYLIFDKLADRSEDRITGYSVYFHKNHFMALNQVNSNRTWEMKRMFRDQNIKRPKIYLLEIPFVLIRRLASIFLYFASFRKI
jgi:hypothetical protein